MMRRRTHSVDTVPQAVNILPRVINKEAVKFIFERVVSNIGIRSLSVAIRQYCLQHRLNNEKQTLLNFFLRCENKLKLHSDDQWRRVFELEVKRLDIGNTLQTITNKVLYRRFWICLKTQLELCRKSNKGSKNFKDNFEETNIANYADIADSTEIEVSKDIRQKTTYFFKWCQYVDQNRQIRLQRAKEEMDYKKAALFSAYTARFTCFAKWKKMVRKQLSDRRKAKTIQQAVKRNLQRSIITLLQNKFEIQDIENRLVGRVVHRMQQFRKAKFMRQLSRNEKYEKQIGIYKPCNNLLAHRFMTMLTEKLIPVFSKARVKVRNATLFEYANLCKVAAFKELKQRVQFKNGLIKDLKILLRQRTSQMMILVLSSNLAYRRKQKKFCTQIVQQDKKRLIKLIKANKLCESGQREKLHEFSLAMQLSQVSSFIQALNTFRRQQLESRVLENSLYNYRLASGKRKVIKGLRYEWSNNRIVRFNTGLSVKTIQAKRVFKNLRLAKELVLQKETLQRQLEQHSEKILFKTALRGLLLAKEVSKAESTAIIKMCRIGERIVQEQCFDIIFASSQLHSEVALLTECAARIIKKMTFLRLVNRMLETKQKHSNFKQKQMLKQKAMLFQLLVQNSLRFRQSLEEARVLCLQYCKKRAIRDIIESNKFRNHKEKCLKRRKMLASNKFIQCCKLRLRCMTKFAVSKLAMKTVVQKMIIRQLIRDRKDRAQSIEQQEDKIYQIQQRIVVCSIRLVQENILLLRNKEAELAGRTVRLQAEMRRCHVQELAKIVDHSHRGLKQVLTEKRLLVMNTRQQLCLSILIFRTKASRLHTKCRLAQASEVINAFLAHTSLVKRERSVKCYLAGYRYSHAITVLKRVTLENRQVRQHKTNLLEDLLANIRERQAKKRLLNQLQKQKQLIRSELLTVRFMLKNRFGEMVKQFLSLKYARVKTYFSLRIYAKSIKQKAFNGLKKVQQRSILKQNRAKTEYHSFTRMEKSVDQANRRNKLSETIERFNLRQSKQILIR